MAEEAGSHQGKGSGRYHCGRQGHTNEEGTLISRQGSGRVRPRTSDLKAEEGSSEGKASTWFGAGPKQCLRWQGRGAHI